MKNPCDSSYLASPFRPYWRRYRVLGSLRLLYVQSPPSFSQTIGQQLQTLPILTWPACRRSPCTWPAWRSLQLWRFKDTQMASTFESRHLLKHGLESFGSWIWSLRCCAFSWWTRRPTLVLTPLGQSFLSGNPLPSTGNRAHARSLTATFPQVWSLTTQEISCAQEGLRYFCSPCNVRASSKSLKCLYCGPRHSVSSGVALLASNHRCCPVKLKPEVQRRSSTAL